MIVNEPNSTMSNMANHGPEIKWTFREGPETAFADEQECELLTYHAPTPVMIQFHHQKPVFLQDRLYGKIMYGPSLWVCANCHDAIHAWLYFLLGEHREPPHVGWHARREAKATFDWYVAECERLGRVP